MNPKLAKLLAVHGNMAGRVRYKLGAKAPSLDCDSHDIARIDCSGYVRYVLHRAGIADLPDGSVNQHDWCYDNWRQLKSAKHLVYGTPDRLFIAFIEPRKGHSGHVWLVHEQKTLECCSSLGGVGRRAWDVTALRSVGAAYEVIV